MNNPGNECHVLAFLLHHIVLQGIVGCPAFAGIQPQSGIVIQGKPRLVAAVLLWILNPRRWYRQRGQGQIKMSIRILVIRIIPPGSIIGSSFALFRFFESKEWVPVRCGQFPAG